VSTAAPSHRASDVRIAADGHEGVRRDHVNSYDILDCETCGFTHVLPLPDPHALKATYAEEYYKDEKPDYLARAAEDAPWAELHYADRLSALSGAMAPGVPRRLLDVGSGPGFFLKSAHDKGWDAVGIEPSRQAASFSRDLGLHVVEAFFETAAATALGQFGAVHMMNMLEHVPNPAELLALAYDITAPGGALCVGVPNDYNPLQDVLRSGAGYAPWWLAPPHHLNYFTFDSLERLVARTGFEPRARLTSFPMEMFLLMGERYVGDEATGRACHTKRKHFDLTLAHDGDARRAFYAALAAAGLGREAVVIAVKPVAEQGGAPC